MAVSSNRVIGSITWSAVSTIGAQAVSFVVFVILARLLGSRDFGLVALAAIVVDLMQIVSAGGVSEAVIQRADLRSEEADTAFWLNIASGAIFCIIGLAASGAVAAAFHQPRLSGVLRVLCLLFLISPLGGIHQARMMRELKFKSLAYRNVLASVFSGVVGVALALAGGGVWALVGQRLSAAVAMVVLVWLFSDWRPRLRFEVTAVWSLLRFGLNLMASQLLVQLNSRVVEMITGTAVGPAAVGFIRAGSRCVDTLSQVTFTPFHQVVLPLQARAAGKPAEERSTYAMLSRTSAIIMFPAFFGLFAIAHPLIIIIFGPSWAPSADAVQIICLSVLPLQFNVLMLSSLAAAGRPRLVLVWSIIQVAVGIVAIVTVAPHGWRWMLGANIVRSYLLLPIGLAVMWRATGIGPRLVLRSIRPAAVAAIFMTLTIMAIDIAWLQTVPVLARLAILLAFGVVSYTSFGLLLDRSLISEARTWRQLRKNVVIRAGA